jgi:hypothetical protein
MIHRIPYSGSETAAVLQRFNASEPKKRRSPVHMDRIQSFQRDAYTIREIAEATRLDIETIRAAILDWLYRN